MKKLVSSLVFIGVMAVCLTIDYLYDGKWAENYFSGYFTGAISMYVMLTVMVYFEQKK